MDLQLIHPFHPVKAVTVTVMVVVLLMEVQIQTEHSTILMMKMFETSVILVMLSLVLGKHFPHFELES